MVDQSSNKAAFGPSTEHESAGSIVGFVEASHEVRTAATHPRKADREPQVSFETLGAPARLQFPEADSPPPPPVASLSTGSHYLGDSNSKPAVGVKPDQSLSDGVLSPETSEAQGESTGGGQGTNRSRSSDQWTEPIPLNDGAILESFDVALLPTALGDWVTDTCERAGTSLESTLPAVFAAIGTAIGNRWVVLPTRHNDDFRVFMTVWSMLVAPPGSKKSAMVPLMSPIRSIQNELIAEDDRRNTENSARTAVLEQKKRALEEMVQQATKKGQSVEGLENEILEVQKDLRELAPRHRRLIVDDATTEKIATFEAAMPRGITQFSDELPGFFATFFKRGRESDESFYLRGWNSAEPFTQDRIGRGSVMIDRHTVIVSGNVQNNKLAELVRRIGNDGGLLQRFQATVVQTELVLNLGADRRPNENARGAYENAIRRLYRLDPKIAGFTGAEGELRLSNEAREAYRSWSKEQLLRTKAAEKEPGFASHISKYQSFMPAIAGMYHLVEYVSGRCLEFEIPTDLVERAIKTAAFFEGHARRLYGITANPRIALAKDLLKALQNLEGATSITSRDLQRHMDGTQANEIDAAREVLESHGWVRTRVEQNPKGGRPSRHWILNPRGR